MTEVEEIETYTSTVQTYLTEADWLTPADAPHKLHLQRLAASLDRQFAEKGEVQSALASTFHKTLTALDRRRPAPAADPMAGQIPGQVDLLTAQFA